MYRREPDRLPCARAYAVEPPLSRAMRPISSMRCSSRWAAGPIPLGLINSIGSPQGTRLRARIKCTVAVFLEAVMRSSFPGMDPYLEDPGGWTGVRVGLI